LRFPGIVPIWRWWKKLVLPRRGLRHLIIRSWAADGVKGTIMETSDRPNSPAVPDPLSSGLRGLPESERTLLIVDDDAPLCQRLARAMERRGFIVTTADSVAVGIAAASDQLPAFAVVDMRLGDGRGFDVVSALRQARPGARIVMLTGYGNIATAVAAVKAGAIDYLPKPADADAVERALLAQEDGTPEPPEDPMSADRVRWEHIQRVFELCDRNVSETARRLKMHRRTLQRILSKHAPRN
jgi:two-component system, response regulator RegA